MAVAERAETLRAELEVLAVEDPRKARAWVGELLDRSDPDLDALLLGVAVPGAGRLRQLIANAARTRTVDASLREHFTAWLRIETDEFARHAVQAVLENTRPDGRRPRARRQLVEPNLAHAYRYATDRLKHQLRNSLLEPAASLLRLRRDIAQVHDDALRTTLEAHIAALSDALDRFGRVLEFDSNDAHFTMRVVMLIDWLRAFNTTYAQRFRAVQLRVESQGVLPRIRASDYFLSTIFWNLWINAQQALSGMACEVAVRFRRDASTVKVTIVDNGPGFPAESLDMVFVDASRRTPGHRGRGLLEVQDAIERLHGTAQLELVDDNYRVVLTFPIEEDR